MFYLGIDLGTSSVKAVLADDNGIIDSASRKYKLLIPKEGWTEQAPEDWWNGTKECVKELSSRHDLKNSLVAMSFCGQMHGLVVLDEEDNVIRPALLWNDQRTVKECDYLNNVIGKSKLIELTGNIAFTGFTAPKVLWIKNNEPENFARIAKIMLPKDYVAYKLSGVFASDVSDDSGTLYFDVKNRRFSGEMCEILSIKKEWLPKVFESYEAVGTVRADVANELNISANTLVVIGGGDQAVGAIGTGTVENNAVSISLGTSGVVFAASDRFVESKEGTMHSFRHANGKYHSMGCMLSCAGALDHFVNVLERSGDFDALTAEAEKRPISDVVFLPYFSGERSPINDPGAKAAFFGMSLSTERGDLTRAVLEGASFGLYDCLKSLNEMGIYPEKARVIGGGTKSKLWMQILADILGIRLSTINTADGGSLGAIILAMTASGRFASVEEGCKALIKDEATFEPDMAMHARYDEKFARFKKLYEATKGV